MPPPTTSATLPAARVAGAGSAVLRGLLAGAPQTGTVVHAGEHAVYARFPVGVVGVVARSAVHVPAAIATTLLRLPPVAVGAPARIGGGTLDAGPLSVGVDRLVATDAPPLPDPAAAAALLAPALPDLAVVRRQPALRRPRRPRRGRAGGGPRTGRPRGRADARR
ncbi:hypothetical protein [Nocardioides convexus]|uniref:hypothetical protein n=1 Tax=Nocardioides convexus TaxID=2712224 RepID=UPI0024186EED|nr:hypothetical protein [Nocardioides convexus]